MNPREHGKRSIDNETRSALKRQRPAVIWLTGLSGAGKSTIANALELALFEQKKHTFLLDGDDLRLGLCRNLGYSDEDRTENIRRIAEVAKILLEAGLIVIVATISPFSRDEASLGNLSASSISSRSLSTRRSRNAREEIPKACTGKHARARSKTSPGSTRSTKRPHSRT